jgi:hypothetical protein
MNDEHKSNALPEDPLLRLFQVCQPGVNYFRTALLNTYLSIGISAMDLCRNGDKLQCAADQVWAEAMAHALSEYDGDNLPDEVCTQVEDLYFMHICGHSGCSARPFAGVLGVLSQHRMIAITSRLTAAICTIPPATQSSGARATAVFGSFHLSQRTPDRRRTSTQCLRLAQRARPAREATPTPRRGMLPWKWPAAVPPAGPRGQSTVPQRTCSSPRWRRQQPTPPPWTRAHAPSSATSSPTAAPLLRRVAATKTILSTF